MESVAFELATAGAAAISALERGAAVSGLQAVVLSFGRLWGPGTWDDDSAPEPPTVRVVEAGRRAVELVVAAPPRVYEVA